MDRDVTKEDLYDAIRFLDAEVRRLGALLEEARRDIRHSKKR